MSTKFISSKKIILFRIGLFLAKVILLEFEQNNFFLQKKSNVCLNVVNHVILTKIFHENRPLQRRKYKIPPWCEDLCINTCAQGMIMHVHNKLCNLLRMSFFFCLLLSFYLEFKI